MLLSILKPIIIISALASIASYALILLKNKYKSNAQPLVEKINKLLPQTQCGQCNFPGCLPYATAITNKEADINRCPPGGQETIDNLASLLNIESKSLAEDLDTAPEQDMVAVIREQECIGCLLCIKACPVDAIVGAPKLMHTVITDMCTGCDLCIAPCPMDCIDMIVKTRKIKYQELKDPQVK